MRKVVLVLSWFFLCIFPGGSATAQTGPDAGGAGLPEAAGEAVDQAAPGLKELHHMADQGNAAAQALLGLMYAEGHGVTKDERQAAAWFQKAADQGEATAQTQLGTMYAEGRGVAKDERQAAAWFQKAADQGDATAQTRLGRMYAEGRGVAKDERAAVEWYRKAAAQGDKDAQDALEAMTLTAPAASNPDAPQR